jgi:DNA polymerase-1
VSGDLSEAAVVSGSLGWYMSRETYCGDYDAALKALFSPEIKKTGHNIKDIQRRLLDRDIPPENWQFDTALAAYLLDATVSNYDLDRLCLKYCGFELKASGGAEQLSLLPSDDGGKDFITCAAGVRALEPVLREKLKELNMEQLMFNIELPLCPVLARMEREGFLVDKTALAQFGEMLSQGIEQLQTAIWNETGTKFNINSPKQLGKVLFEDMEIPAPKKTKSGYSTSADVLEKLAERYPIVQSVLDYRQLTKLKSTYADGLLKVIGADGRIHTSFQMTVTATGRLSSTEPNLQNIPIRTELGGEIRKMFVAAPGNVLVDADYSQIELRLLAHISGDETMREAFCSGEDIHRITASQVFNVPFEDVTPLQRRHAKAVNFGIVYGISDFSLAQDIGVTRAEAKGYMESYLEKYHGVRDYMKNIVEQAREDGYVSTVYGRRRYLPELKSSNFNLRSFGERVALNMPVQGTAADIMKIAMVNVDRRLREEGLEARLILQVHDELIAECPESEAERAAEILQQEMENAANLTLPLTAEAKTGRSWHEAH